MFLGGCAVSGHGISTTDSQALDKLIGAALLDEDMRQQLLHERPDELLLSFALSTPTRTWLRTIPATTLEELAQAILPHQNGVSLS